MLVTFEISFSGHWVEITSVWSPVSFECSLIMSNKDRFVQFSVIVVQLFIVMRGQFKCLNNELWWTEQNIITLIHIKAHYKWEYFPRLPEKKDLPGSSQPASQSVTKQNRAVSLLRSPSCHYFSIRAEEKWRQKHLRKLRRVGCLWSAGITDVYLSLSEISGRKMRKKISPRWMTLVLSSSIPVYWEFSILVQMTRW